MKLTQSIKILSLSLCLGFFTSSALGQAAILALIFGDKVASEEFNISMEIGGAFNEYTNVSNSEFNKIALNFGIAANIKLSENWYLSPAVYFLAHRQVEKSSLSLMTDDSNLNSYFSDVPASINLKYTDIPLIASYQNNKGNMRIGAGVQFSFLRDASTSFTNDQGSFDQNYDSYMENWDYGPLVEYAYNFQKMRKGKGTLVRLRYIHGMNTIFNDNFVDSGVKNRSLVVMITLPFITDELAQKNLDKLK
ncbi:MAG: outer membrane beta-barrel protein [Flavobacteriaceae bacterium]